VLGRNDLFDVSSRTHLKEREEVLIIHATVPPKFVLGIGQFCEGLLIGLVGPLGPKLLADLLKTDSGDGDGQIVMRE
jgi:hypothetical protein